MNKQPKPAHLRDDLAFYRAVINTMQEGVVVQDADGHIVMSNPAAERILGLTAGQMHGRSVIYTRWEIVNEEGLPFAGEMHPAIRALHTGQPQSAVMMGLHKPDGTKIWVEVNCQPLYREGDVQPYGVVSTFTDVTQRRQIEERIRWLAKFPAENPNPVLRISPKGTVIYANASSAALLKVWGIALWQTLPEEPYTKASKALETQTNQTIEVNVESRIIALTLTPDPERQYVNIYGLDITERKRSEEALRESERNVRMLLEAAPIGVIVVDDAGRIVLVNNSVTRLFGYTHAELTHQSLELLIPEKSRPIHNGHCSCYVNAPHIRPMGNETRPFALHKDGHIFPVEISLGFVESARGILTMAFVVDMTRQRELETLREAMIRTMVHDLRNPLGAIYTGLALLKEDFDHTLVEHQKYVLDIAMHNAQKMLELIDSILDVSQLESGQIPLNRTVFQLGNLVRDTLRSMATLAEKKGLRLQNNVPTTLPDTQADVQLIGRVLQNLIGNAIKFTPDGGTVAVSASREDNGKLYVSVSDTGPGIPTDIRARLFQQFVTGNHQERGSGLGLALCKLVLAAHGESITVESKPEAGTTFTFTLPVATET